MAKKKSTKAKDKAEPKVNEKKTRTSPDGSRLKALAAQKPGKDKPAYKRGEGGKTIKSTVITFFKKCKTKDGKIVCNTADLVEHVRKLHPGTKFDPAHVAWYKGQHKTGLLYAEKKRVAKKPSAKPSKKAKAKAKTSD